MQDRKHLPIKKGLLGRQRVAALFSKATAYSLVSVSAAMGFGKSYELAAYLRRTKKRVIWMNLTQLDSVVPRF